MNNLHTLVKDSKHFCILPWIHFHSWPDGKVMPCCVADSTKPVSKINKNESIIQMMNSDDYKKMRLAMLNDEPVEVCKRCYDLEKVGVTTLRQSHNKNHGLSSLDLIESTTNDGTITDFKLKYMDIRFSNLCNMKCRSCGPSCSSLWAQEYIETRGVDLTKQHFGITKMVVNSNEDQIFFSKLKDYLSDVKEVYFAGGEIVITPEHYECLEFWIENNLTDKVKLNYTTNFSVLKYKDKDLISYWKKFPNIEIWASLDAYGASAELMRKGTDWEKIVENIRSLKEAVPHARFQITPTISIWNVWQYPKFFDYLIENDLIDRNTTPRLNLLTSPWFANIMILPDYIREELQELYRDYIFKYCFNSGLVDNFRTVENALKHGGENKEGILEFIRFNEDLDNTRKESILSAIPELTEIYKWAQS